MHVIGENVPLPEAVQLTVPVGELPVTVAVQDVEVPSFTVEGEQDTVVAVLDPGFRANVPELP